MSSELKDKMLQWEAKPPADTWNRIAASLDADEEYVLAHKLSSFESQPPRQVWESIEIGLEARQPANVVSFYQQHKLAFRYSGVAAALIFAVVLINLFIAKPSESNELTHRSSVQTIPQLRQAQSSVGQENKRTLTNGYSDSQTYSDQNSTEVNTGTTTIFPEKHSSKALHPSGRGSGYHAIIAEWQKAKDSLVDRYFVHTNNKGEAIRYSSKLYDLFECSDEWSETECAQQIKLWQQKAATSAIYASADFNGVLEILKGMQEER